MLAISTAVPFTFGINTAHAQTAPTATWLTPATIPSIGSEGIIGLTFNGIVNGPNVATAIRGLTPQDFSSTGGKLTDRLSSTGNTAFIRFTPEEDIFTITLAANSVSLNGVLGPANAVTYTYKKLIQPPTIALAGPDTGASDRDRITGQRGILITLASNFDASRGDTWGISIDGGADNYARTRVDNANAAPDLRFGLPDGKYTDDQVRVRQTVNGVTSGFAGLAAFTFDSTRPTINLNGGDITLTAGQTYTEQASVSDILDTSVRLRVGGDTLDTTTAGTYDLTYDAQDTAGNDAVQLTRTVTVTEPVTLSALTVSPGTLMPDFDPAITAYNVIVGTGVNSISFTPTFRVGTVVIEVDRVSGGVIRSGSTSTRVFAGTSATYNIAVTNGGVSTTYSVTATRNTAPVADAGDDDAAATNAPVALDGSGSSDPNSHVGDTLSYAWEHTLTNGTTPATAITLPDATAESPTFTPTAAGAYTFTLTVTDSVGASHTDTVVITVSAPVDTTAPTVVTFDDPAAGVIGTAQDHDITFDEAVTGLAVGDFSVSNNIVASGDLVVNSVTPASGPGTTYTISITPQATAFTLTLAADSVMDTADTPNMGPANAASASGSATAALAFTAVPALTTNNADPQRAKAGDTLTLAFAVNVALASVPVVTIAGQPITPTGTAGNVYTATYTVAAAEVTDEGAVVSYSTGTLTAAGPAGNTAQITDDSAIRIDLTAPTITLTGGDAPVVLAAGEAYTEQGATATDNVDVSVPTPTPSGAVDPNTPADYPITYTATDRAGNVATKTRTVTVSAPVTATAPEPPMLSAGTITDASVVLEWTAVDNADSYTLTRVVAGGANVAVATATNELTATDTGLTPETTYKYVVTATNSAGTSDNSNEVDATTLATPAPDLATLVIKATTHNSITLSWVAVDNADRYTVTRVVAGGDVNVPTTPELTATDENLEADTEYKYTIAAINSAGTSTSTEFSARTDAAPVTTPAPTVTVERLPDNSIKVSWDNIGGSDFTIYAIKTGVADAEIIDLVTSPHTFATTDPLFDTVNDADAIGIRGFAEGNPVGDHSAPITSDEVPDEAPAVTDTTPPTVTLGTIAEGVIGTAQDYDITFSEAVTGLAVGDFSVSSNIVASGDLVVNSVTPASGPSATYTISIIPRATAFTLTLTANSVMDTAAPANMGPATAASAVGSATAAVALTAPGTQSYTLGTAVDLTLPAATGGTAPLTYVLTGPADGALPTGLTFTAASRTLSGTPGTEATTTLTYTVTDATAATATADFTVTVNAGLVLTAPDNQSYTVDTAIDALILPAATGGTGTLRYALTGLPAGLSFNAGTRTLSGTPTAAAATELTYTVTDTNDASTSQTFTVTVNTGLALPAPDDQFHTVNTAITDLQLPEASGGTGPLSYTLTGALQAGLSFNAGTRTLSGTPTVAGTTTLTYTVTDTNGDTASQTFIVIVNTGLVLNTLGDQSYTLNTEITALVLPEATGGTLLLTYALTNLPDGLAFDAVSLTLSGTPTAAASTELTYTVTDTNGATASQTFTVAVNTGLALSAPPAPSYTVDTAIDALVLSAATGGTGALTYTLTGPAGSALPGGLTFAAGTRTLSGTPSTADVTVLTYTVTDTNGATATADFAVTVNAGLALTSPGAQGYTVDTAIDALVLPAATGGTAPLSYTLTGLPGLSFTAGTRTLSGTPSTVGSTALAYRVTDANGATASQIFTVTVNTGLTLTAPDNQSYTVNTAIDALVLLEASGGTAPLNYTLTGLNSADLSEVPGLTFTAGTRTLSGTPTAVTSATTLTYTVTDANGATASQTFMVTVNEARTPPPPRPTDPTPEPDPEPEPNTAPVADAGAPPIAAEGATVTLNGRGSSDPDDDTLTYAWRQTGGTSVSLSGANTATPGFTAPSLLSADAELVFRLTVSDGSLSATDTVTVTVTHVNDAPGADAGEPQTVAEGATVTLRGTGTDPDGDDAALRYAWSQTDNDAPRVSLSGADTATPGFTAPSLLSADAELVFRLTVSDGAVSATDTVTITVTRPLDTVAPVITLLGDSPLDVNQGTTYTDPGATASDDTDGDLSAGIIVGGDTVDTDTIGAYSVTYDVSDAAGNAAATVTRIVRVVVARDLAALNEAILPEVARDIADRNVSAIARRIEQARLPSRVGSSASLGGASSLAEIATSQGSTVADGRFDLKRLLNNSNFVLQLHETGAGAADGTQLTLWGAGDYRDLKGADGVRWSGDLFSLQLGLDARLNERTILGVSVSGSKVELGYTNPGPAAGGNYDLDMTSVHPYLGWSAGGLDFWATLGYGEGELEISADGAQADIPSIDLSMQTLGLGANGVLMATGTTTVLLKTEALSTQLEVDASEEITAITQQAHRVRMTLEAIRGHSLDSGARLETSLEAGLRYDGGDGETGAGAELGGGLRYASDSGGLVIEGRARALVGGKGDTEEWGLSGLIKLSPAANGRGLSFSLTPGYGVTASGVERLWQQGLDDGLEAQGGTDGNNYTPNLDLRLDYGMDVSAMPGLVTPYSEFSFGATGDTYRLGLQWQRSKWFDLKLVAELEAGQITADHRIYIEGEIVF